ncbi:hypothetical protein AA0Z99_00155 [Agrococcus sp. 1P02AA]|uniref:hypothetical protein n=1 Tax=Agrococcus sp. 1P02AA TaxID=3132259 RepID=UPI0039A671BA
MSSEKRQGKLLGYSRVATSGQDARVELEVLGTAGAGQIFTVSAPGRKAWRP